MSDGYSRDTFLGADEQTRIKMTFDIMSSIDDKLTKYTQDHETRIKKLENRRWRDKGVASVSGVFGGFLAIFSERFWK